MRKRDAKWDRFVRTHKRDCPFNNWRWPKDTCPVCFLISAKCPVCDLDSGPYTTRQSVLTHLGWIGSYADVYGDYSVKYRVERSMR